MIVSFGDKASEDLFHGRESSKSRRIPAELRDVAFRKLDMLNAAHSLDDLRSPPGNRLEKLRRELRGHWCIRINEQWRVIFRWSDEGPSEVRIVDYHR